MTGPEERATTEPRKAQPGSCTNRRTTPDTQQVVGTTGSSTTPRATICIADPPYPPHFSDRLDAPGGKPRTYSRSRARRWYGDQPGDDAPADFHPNAGEWDNPARHRALIEQLHTEYDGWAIATTLDGIEHYTPLPAGARVLIWHNPRRVPSRARIATTCEAVIIYTPIQRRHMATLGQVPDLLVCSPPHIGFPGAKPAQWTRWVLDALAYDPDMDTLVDMFPGSGSVAAAAAQGVLL